MASAVSSAALVAPSHRVRVPVELREVVIVGSSVPAAVAAVGGRRVGREQCHGRFQASGRDPVTICQGGARG
jgi:hypothetical protein